jgi:hypothetical protein
VAHVGGGAAPSMTLPRQAPPPAAWSDLVTRLDAADRPGGSGESRWEIIESELPLLNIRPAVRDLWNVCADGRSVDCAGALGSVAGGALALERLVVRPVRGHVARAADTGWVDRLGVQARAWWRDSGEVGIAGPSGQRHQSLVPVGADVEVPLAPPQPPFGYAASYLDLLEQVRASPALHAEQVQGRLLGHGDYKRVYEFEPEPRWVIKVPQAGEATPAPGRLTGERLLPIAREVVTAERLSAIGIPANTAHGLVRLDFGNGVTGVAYVADAIPGAMLFKGEVGLRLMRNLKLGMPLEWQMSPRALAALNNNTLDSLDLVHQRKVEYGFRIEHEQPLLDPATGRLVQQDAQGIVSIDDVYGPMDLTQNLHVRNTLADLLGRPRMAMPDLSGVEFRPWWGGQPSGVALLRP